MRNEKYDEGRNGVCPTLPRNTVYLNINIMRTYSKFRFTVKNKPFTYLFIYLDLLFTLLLFTY